MLRAEVQPSKIRVLTWIFILLFINMKNLQLEKIWISLDEMKKMQKIVDETYYNLCDLWLYGDIYYKLQNLHGWIDDLLQDEHLDEDSLDEIWCFYENNFKK